MYWLQVLFYLKKFKFTEKQKNKNSILEYRRATDVNCTAEKMQLIFTGLP